MSFRIAGSSFEYFNAYGMLSESDTPVMNSIESSTTVPVSLKAPHFHSKEQQGLAQTIVPEVGLASDKHYFGSLPSPPHRNDCLVREELQGSDQQARLSVYQIETPPDSFTYASDAEWAVPVESRFGSSANYAESIELAASLANNFESIMPLDAPKAAAFEVSAEHIQPFCPPEAGRSVSQKAGSGAPAQRVESPKTTTRKARRSRKQYGTIYDENGKEILDPVKRSRRRIALLIEEDILRRKHEEKERAKIAVARIARAERRAKTMDPAATAA